MLTIDRVRSVELISSDIQVVKMYASGRKGSHRFTHDVTINMLNNEFDYADVLCAGGHIVFTNDKEAVDDFEQTYPGAINMAKKAIKDAYTEVYASINKLMEDN